MSEAILVALVAGAPGVAGLVWQIIKWSQGRFGEEVGLLAPLRAEVEALRKDLKVEREARASENDLWRRKCATLEGLLTAERLQRMEDVARLEAQIKGLS